MKVYVLRHAMPHEIRLEPGGLNPGLCDLGVAQAEKLASEVKLLGFKKAYCSPAARTIATAEALGIEIVIRDDLNYVQLKEDRIQAFAKEVEENPDYWKELWTSRNFPGLETPEKFLARIKSALREIMRQKEKVLVVAHTEVILAMLAIAKKKPLKDVIGEKVEYATIYVFEIEEDAI